MGYLGRILTKKGLKRLPNAVQAGHSQTMVNFLVTHFEVCYLSRKYRMPCRSFPAWFRPIFKKSFTTIPYFFLWLMTSSVVFAQPCALNVTSGATTLSGSSYSYCSISVAAGATLVINEAVTLNVTGNVDIEGTINGIGLGFYGLYFFPQGQGPGTGAAGSTTILSFYPIYYGGSGGSHGGAGGAVAGATPAPTYDTASNPVSMGSGGGDGAATFGIPLGGAGGAALLLNAPSGNVTLNGIVDVSGSAGAPVNGPRTSGAGGGAGGTFSVDALGIFGTGSLTTNGGAGGQGNGNGGSGGGGGGGGRIRLCASNGMNNFAGSVNVSGGPGGYEYTLCGLGCSSVSAPAGADGTYYNCAPTATPTVTPSPTSTNTPILTATPTPTVPLIPTSTSSPTPTITDTPDPGSRFFVSKNILDPGSGPVSIYASSPTAGPCSVRIFNSAGEFIKDLGEGTPPTGPLHSFSWNGTNSNQQPCASGLYVIYCLRPGATNEAKILLLR
jgi:hypothetical protein